MAQTGRVLSFLRARPSSGDWTQQELAEFYRVEGALLQGGLSVTTDRGFSDEGDPWFVFCRPDNEEVIAHFARIDGDYLVISSAFSGVARGRDFKLLIRELMQAHPLMLSRNHGDGQRVFLHPSALLAAFLAASYLISSDKHAAAQDLSDPGHEKESGFWLHFRHDFAILSAVAIAATWSENHVEPAFDFGQHLTLLQDTGHDSHQPVDHAIDAAFFDTAAQALHDDAISPHGVAGDPVHAFTLDATNDVNGVTLATSSNVPTHSTVASTPDTTVTAAFRVEGMSAAHTDDMTASHYTALNDVGPLSSSVPAGPNFAIAAVQPLASSAMAPANLGSSSIVPTGTVGEVTNDLAVFKQEIVVSTTQFALTQNTALSPPQTTQFALTQNTALSPPQNTAIATPSPASDTQTSASTTGSGQAFTDGPAQVAASTGTQASTLNSITQQSDAQPKAYVRESHIDHLETPHTIVGIMSHDFVGLHTGA